MTMPRRGRGPRATAVLVLACLHAPRRAAAAAADTWCRARGFDPSTLACDTCALLADAETLQSWQQQKNAAGEGAPIDVVAECRACCQAHKTNPLLHPETSLRGKYRSALLTYSAHGLEQEMKDFLERDVEDVLLLKGARRFQAVESENAGGPDEEMLRMMGMMGGGMMGGGAFGAGPPKLLLFETQKKEGWTEEDEEEAGEVMILRGWKREDLKDMLLTLLPNA